MLGSLLRRFLPLSVLATCLLCADARATVLPSSQSLGLNPGEQYAFVFVTSATTAATSNSAATYNTFVQTAADNASIGTSAGMTWKAIVSTGASPNRAIDNAPMANTVKVFRIDGTMVANGGSVPFYALIPDHLAPINVTELNTTVSHRVWTGGNANGTESGSGLMGSGSPVSGTSAGVAATSGDPNGWSRIGNEASSTQNNLYALSNVLTAPEPGSLSLVGMAIVPLALRRRRGAGRTQCA